MKRALVVGINNYPSAPLRACINDATAIGNLLRLHEDGSPNFQVELKTNLTTKFDLSSLIWSLFSTKCDTALLYFSGHGFINQLGGYIVTPDAQRFAEGVSMDDILLLSNQSDIENKIIILDCCHAGAIGLPLTTGCRITQIKDGTIILAASRSNESAIEAKGHGLFTKLLLDALEGGAADIQGNVTAGNVYAYVEKAFGPWHQRPLFKANISDSMSIRTVKPQVDTSILRKLPTYFQSPEFKFPLNPEYEFTHPHAQPERVAVFKHLQQLQSIGLLVPVEEEHMYYAAINSKSCKLTALGQHYWELVYQNRI